MKQLQLQNNHLTQLHAESFTGITFESWYSILDISHNKLQVLPPRVFSGAGWLRVLNLAHNELSELPDFEGLDDLRSLKLEGNRLQRLHQDSFYCGSSLEGGMPLEDLSLEQNQLTELHPDCFVFFPEPRNLLDLKLGGNRLTALPDGLFNGGRGLSELRTLQLQSNRLARLPRTIFQTLGLRFGGFFGSEYPQDPFGAQRRSQAKPRHSGSLKRDVMSQNFIPDPQEGCHVAEFSLKRVQYVNH